MSSSASLHIVICAERIGQTPLVGQHARMLAAATGARLSLLHIKETGATEAEPVGEQDGIQVIAVDRHGASTPEAIVLAAGRIEADLIAMESRNLSMIGHLVRGSTAMRVLGGAAIPVLIAGPHSETPRGRDGYHIVICSDGSGPSEAILSSIENLLAIKALRFTLLRVHEPRLGDEGRLIEMESCEEYVRGLRARLPHPDAVACRVAEVEGLESVPHAINRIAYELNADAVSMATRGQTAARHVLVGSVALAVAQYATVPVILGRG